MEPTWEDIITLAAQFDCKEVGMHRAAAVADQVRSAYGRDGGCSGMVARDLQICLSFECHSLQHCGLVPQGDDFAFLAAVYRSLCVS